MNECPPECQVRLKELEKTLDKFDATINRKPGGIVDCLSRKVGWKQLGTVAGILLVLVGVIYTSYSRGQDKQDEAVKEVRQETKADHEALAKMATAHEVMAEKMKTLAENYEKQEKLTGRIWKAIRNMRDNRPPEADNDEP